MLTGANCLLLDEPTNNLDLDARKRLYDAVASWSGVMVIVSHDRELLALMDQIADLSGGVSEDRHLLLQQIGRLEVAVASERADAAQLVQLFQNLVGNALKYAPPRSPVTIGASVSDGWLA